MPDSAPPKPATVTVSLQTPGGPVRQRWQAAVLEDTPERLVLHGPWARVLHTAAGEVPVLNQTLECYWTDRPYTVSAVYDERWRLREFSARQIRPAAREGSALRLVDLGRTLRLAPGQPPQLGRAARTADSQQAAFDAAWRELVEAARRRAAPFDAATFDPLRPKG